jgi:methyl-accepting chemotaxis protein
VSSLSLKWKILLSVTVTCVAAVIVTTVVTVRSGIATTEETIIDDARTLARVLGQASTGAIAFGDQMTVDASLEALSVSPRVLGATVYAKGEPFATFIREGQTDDFPASAPSLGVSHTEGGVVVNEEITEDGRKIGTISMKISLSEVDALVTKAIAQAFWVVLLVSAVAAGLAWVVQQGTIKPINRVVRALQDISEGEGDLTRRLPVDGNDEIAQLARCFNTFVERLHSIISHVAETAQQVSGNADMLSQLSKESERSVHSQQSEIHEILAAIKEMTGVVEDVTYSVTETAAKASEADESAASGRTIVAKTTRQIDSLSKEIATASEVIDRLRNETVSIGSVLDVIRSIAEQTNLLALNAAIEAARAGEQGRGFAVVADEVRTLASRTQSSTTEIQEMIERLQIGSKEAVDMMAAGTAQASETLAYASEATDSLEDITGIVGVIRDRTNQIAAASEQQSATTKQISSNIDSISSAAVNTAESSSRITANAASLADVAERMTELVGRFKL